MKINEKLIGERRENEPNNLYFQLCRMIANDLKEKGIINGANEVSFSEIKNNLIKGVKKNVKNRKN